MRPFPRPALLAPVLAVAALLAAPAVASAADLKFGVFPWGAAGATGSIAPSVPENAAESMRTVQALRGSKPLVVHLYGDYDGVSNASVDGLLSEASWWSANGLQVSAVLRYRPADASKAAGYPAWVRTQVRRLAALSGTVSVVIGNEPNNPSPGAGDGSYPGVIQAIASAIPAARAELVAAGRGDVAVGFNWAAGSQPTTTEPMWSQLRAAGGAAFTSSVGFVGVNVYPGTWSPPAASSVPTAGQVATTIRATLEAMRTAHMPAAGVGGAPIVITETGYPTTASRTEATQDLVTRSIIQTVDATKDAYGVTGLYAFALRDGNTASGQLENGYGFLRDDYSAKAAFGTLQARIANGPSSAPPPAPEPVPGLVASPSASTARSTPDPSGGEVLESAKLQVARARILRSSRELDLLAPITRRATGNVEISVEAAGRTTRFTAPIDSENGRVRVRRSIPATQARAGTAIITIEYAGNERTRSQTVRLRAASGRARLDVDSLSLTKAGRLRAKGDVTDRVRGVVRLQLQYALDGETKTVSTHARIDDGRWSVSRQLSEKVRAEIARRTGPLHTYTLFTGHYRSRTRGEMRSKQLLATGQGL